MQKQRRSNIKKLSFRALDVIHSILLDARYRTATRKARVLLARWAEPYVVEVRCRVMAMDVYDAWQGEEDYQYP